MIEERRKHKREKSKLALKIADQTFDIITETVDISLSGIYCRITRFLPIMSKIEVILLVPLKAGKRQTYKVKCKGVVVRTEPVILQDTDKAHYNVAIFFTEVSKRDQNTIESYLASDSADEEKIGISK